MKTVGTRNLNTWTIAQQPNITAYYLQIPVDP